MSDPRLQRFFDEASSWKAERKKLRALLRAAKLDEELKWGKACYTLAGKNVAILQPMKAHLALMFFKGSLLDDPGGVLERPGENSHVGRRLCFTSVDEIKAMEPQLRDFLAQAVAIERAGRRVEKARPELVLADELKERLAGDPKLKAAFDALTPGRQREYNLHVTGAKQPATRARRVERCAPKILAGNGLRD